MGVYLHMKIGKHIFNLGRSHKYISCMESNLDTNMESLYDKKQWATDEIERQIVALASHHPTAEELKQMLIEIGELVSEYADEMEKIGRCMTLAEIADNDKKIEFKVE